MASTTRGGKYLSTRPQISNDVVFAVTKVTNTIFLAHHCLGPLLGLLKVNLMKTKWILKTLVVFLGF
jgi:hypothetical protein